MKTLGGKLWQRFRVVRLLLCIVLAITANAGLAKPVQAAGTYNHTWFVERAIQRLQADGGYPELVNILNTYPGVVNFGTVFPDLTYGDIDGDWGESMHDTGDVNNIYAEYLKFLDANGYDKDNIDLQLSYYREFLDGPNSNATLPKFRAYLMAQLSQRFNNNPRSVEDEKAIAFLFGLIAHQEADHSWHWKNPAWLGLEEYAKNIGLTSCDFAIGSLNQTETCLDVLFRQIDGTDENPIETTYLPTIKPIVLASSDAAGIPRPECKGSVIPGFCLLPGADPLDNGLGQVELLWLNEIFTTFDFPISWINLVRYYVPGGMEYGSAFITGAWMQTWDIMSYTGLYYAKPSASGEGNCHSWDDACTLRYALGHSLPGQEIWVAAGVHTPTTSATDRNATFKISYMDVYGGFAGVETARNQRDPAAHLSILSGDIDNNDVDADSDEILENASGIRGNNSYHVVTGATGSTLDGFVVTAGNADDGHNCPGNGSGGGMQNLDAGMLVSNITFSGNAAVGCGGGMYIWSSKGDGSIPNPMIKNVTFIGNTAWEGGGLHIETSQPGIANVTFINNSADIEGGGMYINSSFLAVGHATFANNHAGWAGGGVLAVTNPGTSVVFRNSIFWGNTAWIDEQVYQLGEPILLVMSIVQGGCPLDSLCTYVNGADPKLGPLGYYGGSTPTIPLLAGSSAIDAAEDFTCLVGIQLSGAEGLDQRGVTRPMGDCDIGAYEADDSAPSLTSFARHDPATNPTNLDQLVFRVTFSKNVHNVHAADFNVIGTTASITDITAVSNSVYDVTVAGGDLPDLDGIVGLDLAAGQDIADIGENALPDGEPAIDETYEVSNAVLSLISFTRQSPATSPTNADMLVFRASFSAAAQYVDKWGFDVTGTTASIILVTAIDSHTYDITVSGGDLAGLNGTVGVDLSPFAEIGDLNGDLIPIVEPGVDETYEVDNAAPSLISYTRHDPHIILTNADTLVFRVSFNEGVQNVDLVDFTVSGTTATVISVSPVNDSVYDLTVAGGDLAAYNGMVNLNLAAGHNIQDLAGNALPAGEPGIDETYTVDHIAPSLNSFRRWLPPFNPTNDDTLIFEVNFNEAVLNIEAADFTVTGTTATVIGVGMISAGRYHLTVAGGDLAGLTGTVGLDLALGQDIADLAGNPLLADEPPIDETFTMDNTAPALISIIRLNPASSPTSADVLTFRVTLSEDVRNVDTGDFAVTGSTATVSLLVGSFLGTTYDLTVSGGDLAGLNGTVGLDLAVGQNIEDLGRNLLPAGEPETDETYLVDNIDPIGTSILRQNPLNSPTNASSVTFRVTFGEAVQNVDLADFGLTVTDTVLGSINAINPISAGVSDVVITVVGGDGILDLNFASGNDITDMAGNPLGADPALGTEQTYTIDNTFPIVLFGVNTIPAQNSAMYIGPTQLFIEFSEDMAQDGSDEAANNLSNYMLVEAGENFKFDTENCADGRISDDMPITINNISYSNNDGTGPFFAILDINFGVPLRGGSYQLFICGTTSIHDLAGNHMYGGISDGLLNFSVIKVLPNTGFAPNSVTRLPDQPAEKIYSSFGSLWLEIRTLGVKIPIVGVPLSVGGSWDVSWLGQDAGWLNGSAFPTQSGNSVLTGHVYDSFGYPGPFTRLNQLKYGDEVIVHAWGELYVYEVREVLQVKPGSASAMLKHQKEPWVTLVTCRGFNTSTNSYAYRVLVRAVLTDVR